MAGYFDFEDIQFIALTAESLGAIALWLNGEAPEESLEDVLAELGFEPMEADPCAAWRKSNAVPEPTNEKEKLATRFSRTVLNRQMPPRKCTQRNTPDRDPTD